MISRLKNIFKSSSLFSKLYIKLHLVKTKKVENKVLKKLKSIEKLDESEVYTLQSNMLINMLDYAYKNTSYYKEIFDKKSISTKDLNDFRKIPFLDKKIIKENTNKLLSKEFNISELGKRNTGGSTGQPLEFYCNTHAGLLDYGHHAYLYSLMGHKKDDIILSCGGIEIEKKIRDKNIFWLQNNKGNLFGDYRFSVLYLTDENIKVYVDKLLEIKPSILRGYPSFFDTISKYIIENKINIDFKIKGINLTSEMCTPEQRKSIEKAFSSMVYFEYGHNEVSLYCYTKDDTYEYISSPIYGYIEVLNDDGTNTEIGEVGNIIATGFNNKGMPFIRYKTGDLGELTYRNGGVVKFKSIYGRSQDFILSKKRQKIYLTALIFGQHLKAFANITKWQIEQEEIGLIKIRIIKGRNYSYIDEKEIEEKIKSATEIDIIFEYVDNIDQTKRGKHLFLIQKIKL